MDTVSGRITVVKLSPTVRWDNLSSEYNYFCFREEQKKKIKY